MKGGKADHEKLKNKSTAMNSETQNNAHPATLIPMLLLAIWFICQSYASADVINVTGPGARTGLPAVSSFVPANAAVGDSVYANLDYSTVTVDHKTVTAVRLVAADGSAVSAPATVHGDRLIEFRIPSGAVSGNVTMAGGDGSTRSSGLSISVIPPTLRARGVVLVNKSQFSIGRVVSGTQTFIPSSRVLGIAKGSAFFISATLSATVAKPFDISLVNQSFIEPMTLFTQSESVRLFKLPGRSLPVSNNVTLTIEPVTVAEALGATSSNANWKILQRGLNRSMVVTPEGSVRLNDAIFGGNPNRSFQIEEIAWNESNGSVTFALRDGSARVGSIITLYPPYDALSCNRLGHFNSSDERDVFLAPADFEANPILARRR